MFCNPNRVDVRWAMPVKSGGEGRGPLFSRTRGLEQVAPPSGQTEQVSRRLLSHLSHEKENPTKNKVNPKTDFPECERTVRREGHGHPSNGL